MGDSVKISTPSLVTPTVCSNWADSERSRVVCEWLFEQETMEERLVAILQTGQEQVARNLSSGPLQVLVGAGDLLFVGERARLFDPEV